jgi:hypothetical protein
MRIERLLMLTLAMALCGANPQAQQDESDRDREGDRAAEASGGPPAQPEAGGAPGVQEARPPEPPTRFIPRETISPDSVIAFPADI